MSNISQLQQAYAGARVLVTGHTGFKGAWLCEWLLSLGARVTGYSLPPPTDPSLFEQLQLAERLDHRIGDVRNRSDVRRTLLDVRPDYVFHLAAQPLVRLSYKDPVSTYETNVMGTVHVLDPLRDLPSSCAAIAVTTDKCYENKEWLHAYRENDPMGGYDPYSSSKGAAELVISAFQRSYFASANSSIALASARAGNVIGGGDWADDRIVPDCIRALKRNEPIVVRNKVSTRPWQHVLEPISGYLLLAAAIAGKINAPGIRNLTQCNTSASTAFNFGPVLSSNQSVARLVDEVLKHWPGEWIDRADPSDVHEARLLNLATDKAFHLLGWQPRWTFEVTVEKTVEWYREAEKNSASDHMRNVTLQQICEYSTE